MPLGMEVGLGSGDIVLDGTELLPKGAQPPIFGPMSIVAKRLDTSVYHLPRMYARPRRHCVRWGPSSPLKGAHTPFSAHVYCGQTAGWIKMALGKEVGLGLRDIVFDVDPATPRKRAHPPHPIFGPCLLWPNGWMDEDAALYGSRPRPRPHCTRRGPSSRERGTVAPLPLFGPCLLWPRSPISATAELVFQPRQRDRPESERGAPSGVKGHSPW